MSEEQAVIEEEATEQPAENVEETTTEGETTEAIGEGEPKELEEWQKTAEEQEGEKPVFEKSLKAKKKLKGLLNERETELTEQQKENERLRLENEQLKSGSLKSNELPKRPLREDFEDEYGDVDTEKYRVALSDYDDKREEIRRASTNAEASQKAYDNRVNEGVEDHYNRAEELVESSGVNPDLYKSADTKLRRAVDDMFPGKGDLITNNFLANLGKGSEKVAFYIGNNEAAREKLQSLLRSDPNGIKAAMYLGAEKERLNTNKPAKQQSKAPSPATKVKGDALPPGKEGAWKKKYNAAKEGQEQYNIAKQARAEGFNTRGW